MLVNDFLAVVVEAYLSGMTGTYHVAGAERTSQAHFAHLLARDFRLPSELIRPVSQRGAEPAARRPLERSLATRKISQALGQPMPLLREGLERFRQLWDGDYVNELRGAPAPLVNVA